MYKFSQSLSQIEHNIGLHMVCLSITLDVCKRLESNLRKTHLSIKNVNKISVGISRLTWLGSKSLEKYIAQGLLLWILPILTALHDYTSPSLSFLMGHTRHIIVLFSTFFRLSLSHPSSAISMQTQHLSSIPPFVDHCHLKTMVFLLMPKIGSYGNQF